jgi:hypothetical protein
MVSKKKRNFFKTKWKVLSDELCNYLYYLIAFNFFHYDICILMQLNLKE